MIGDKLIIKPHHTDRAMDIVNRIGAEISPGFTITVAGESGAGKSEVAYEIARQLIERGIKSDILQQDDYFVFPPKTNHEMRRRNIEQVGLYEVKLDFMDSNLRSFKRAESPIFKPLVNFDEDIITTEELDTSELTVLLAEGTYTTLLTFVDFRVFIDRDYTETLEARKERGRDKFEPFVEDVLEREHRIISLHKEQADAVISSDFNSVHWAPN
ncbi:MAG: adenylyl-sulfate kinase [Chloroflexota bacterium]|nr:adenylyl-sulfate kinase [Chloroflexota bacterium]